MITIVIPYPEAGKYFEKWAHEENLIDFKKDVERAVRCTISYAAEEICTYLIKAGLDVVVSDKKGDRNIFLSCENMGGEEFDIKSEGNDIYLLGNSRKGLLYAAYELLECQGIRWYTPQIEYVSKIEELKVPECKHYKYDMPDGRGFHFEGLLKESESLIIWMARNRMNLHACYPHSKKLQEKLCFTFKTGGHIFEKLLDPKNIANNGGYYIDVHKDWYGKRDEEITADNALGVQFCVSNEELLEELAKIIIDKIKGDWKNEDVFELAGFDTWGASCNCANCEKLGNGSDRTLHFLSHIRKRVNEAYEKGEIDHNVRLSFDAYEGTDTMEAPINPVPENLIQAGDYPLFCPILRCYAHDIDNNECDKNQIYNRTLNDWAKTGMPIAMNEYYNVSKYEDLPILFTKRMKNDIKYYIDKGVSEIQYMHTPVLSWGVRSLSQYLYANISRNRNCDTQKLIKKYFSDVYEKHADKVEKCYDIIEKATEYCGSWRNWAGASILTNILSWNGKTADVPFYHESHLGNNAVKSGYETVNMLKEVLGIFLNIKKEETGAIRPEIFDNGRLARNPEEQRKNRAGIVLIDKLSDDIRGIRYGIDVFEMMTMCLDYYNSLYEKRGDDGELYDRISLLAEKMSEYIYGIEYRAYNADTAFRDALERSQLKELYYKITAYRMNGEK